MVVMRQFALVLVVLAVTAFCAAQAVGKTVVLDEADQWQPSTSLPADLEAISQNIEKGKAKKATKEIEKWIKDNPASPQMDQALFLKGRALFQRKLYYQSFVAYDKLVTDFPDTELFSTTLSQQVEIARRFLAGAKRKVWGFIPASAKTEALEILDRVIEKWPGSELAATALMMQADYYYQKRKYIEAQQTYQSVVQDYTGSSYYQKAMRRNAESTYIQFMGPRYQGTCLLDARIRYEQYQARFPEDAEQLGVAGIIEKITNQLAEKEFLIADFYRRTGKIPAAQYYWAYIINHWPDSSYARESRAWLHDTQVAQ
jgi:outer membrane protein assembly factor BamD (BamD/ComL family)